MKLLIIILNKEKYLDDLLSSLVEVGIIGATVIEATRMTEILANDIPIFAGLRQLSRGGRSYNKVIIAPLGRTEIVTDLLNILRDLNIDLSNPEIGFLFTIPIEDISVDTQKFQI